MILNKYLAAILNIVGVFVAAVIAALKAGPVTSAASDQIVILVIGAVVVYFVPLLNTRWAGLLKVIAAALTAAATALYPALVDHVSLWPFTAPGTASLWLTVGIAVLNALGVGVGVSARLDSIRLNQTPALVRGTVDHLTLGTFRG